jgi:hypothetical protein
MQVEKFISKITYDRRGERPKIKVVIKKLVKILSKKMKIYCILNGFQQENL